MAIKIRNNDIYSCSVAINTVSDADLDIEGNKIVNCGQGILIRGDVSSLSELFIGSEIPAIQLIDVLQQLGKGTVSVESINEMVSDKGISSYLSDASNIITVSEKIYEWYTSGIVGDVLSQLHSMVG
ncbi:hypothetical protein ACLHZ0_20315 [Aeromonas salmonicida]|uniref:hypothetical protein n=1 Tax=Aeromonas salmonicida TaxID=645 RepID=UPI0011413524|nr:hypothetical protein [Aeromonas salmonicida]